MPPKYSQRVRAKSPYILPDGTPVVGVTTALREMNKPYLVPWSNKLGLAGVDSGRYRDEMGMVGTLIHALVNGHLKGLSEGESVDKYDYSQREIDLAGNGFSKFLAWEKTHTLEPIMLETPMVSEVHRFGGTPDYYGLIDGVLTLADWKSGANLYWDSWVQMAAYGILLDELGHRVEQRILLNIGRDETENFVEAKRSGPSLDDEVSIFLSCLNIYEAKRRLKYD
jgi:hypothetical protein